MSLTTYQQQLIDGLVTEFTRINPKPTTEKRFSLESIMQKRDELQQFKDSLYAYNIKIFQHLLKGIKADINTFKIEFGKALDIQIGTYDTEGNLYSTFERMLNELKVRKVHDISSLASHIYILSRTKEVTRGGGYCHIVTKNKRYVKLYLSLDVEHVKFQDFDNNYGFEKIVGLSVSKDSYLIKNRLKNSKLTELIQIDKFLQQGIAGLI